MVDFGLTDEQRMHRDTARAFAQREIRRIADAMTGEDGSGSSAWRLLRPAFVHAASLGFTRVLTPVEYGGAGGSGLDHVIVMEEFGAADFGIASAYFNLTMTLPLLILEIADERQRRRWLPPITGDPEHVLALLTSEPAGTSRTVPYPLPEAGMHSRWRVQRDGDRYVLNGRNSAPALNLTAAKSLLVMARMVADGDMCEGASLFLVPVDLPGVTVGTTRGGAAQSTTGPCAEVRFREVSVPLEHRIGDVTSDVSLLSAAFMAAGLAAACTGVARAAGNLAFEAVQERTGGTVRKKRILAPELTAMAAAVEAARLTVWKLAWAADCGLEDATGFFSSAAVIVAAEAAVKNTEQTVEILKDLDRPEQSIAQHLLQAARMGERFAAAARQRDSQ